MKMNHEPQLAAKKRKSPLLVILILAAAAGIGFGAWQGYRSQQQAAAAANQAQTGASSAYQASTVRGGDLALSISGTGSVVTAQSVDLGFAVEGTLAELNVQVGDTVSEGQALAKLANLTALEQAVKNQELVVQTAKKTLEGLQSSGPAALAQAAADLAAAQTAFAEAEANLHEQGDARCAVRKTQEYYFAYLEAQKNVDAWETYLDDPDTGYGRDYLLEKLAPLRKARDQAYIHLKYCEGYREKEIQEAQAAYELAKAELDRAARVNQDLEASQGVDPRAVEMAQAQLMNAELQLRKARRELDGSVITAPMGGTVMAVNGSVGQAAGTTALITIADLEHPLVQVNIDETDLANFAVGCDARVTFDSLPGQEFPGIVTAISPSLVSVQSVGMVQGLVDLEKDKTASGKVLPPGLKALVEVTCTEEKN